MYIQAILAPPSAGVTPEQRSRAQRALMEQMMLLARGHDVDSVAVRCAAAMVGSAVAADPSEFELLPSPAGSGRREEPTRVRTGDPRHRGTFDDESAPENKPEWQRGDAYRRYLRTIMSGNPN